MLLFAVVGRRLYDSSLSLSLSRVFDFFFRLFKPEVEVVREHTRFFD